jgi:hypothetical protein
MFYEKTPSGNRVVPCGRRDRRTGGQTDTMKLLVALREFANLPKNGFERIQKEIALCCIKQTNKQT